MRAARFCLNPYYREVHEGCLSHNNNNSDKTIHNLQHTSVWIRSLKTKAKHYILLFSLFYSIKEIFLGDFFMVALFIKFPTREIDPGKQTLYI